MTRAMENCDDRCHGHCDVRGMDHWDEMAHGAL